MTTLTTVKFADLVAPDAINARSATKDGLDALADSIAVKGLIQPLAVRPADGGKYEVIDGRRRFQALAKLVKSKRMKKSDEVAVIVRNEDDADALETSLIANTVRLPMHPVDQYGVFARLADEGRSVADIAARFGISERSVRQQMALGQLAEPIREAWRKGKLDAEAAQAFCIEPRQELQVAAFERVKKERGNSFDAWSVRSALSGSKVRLAGKRPEVLDRYLAAGGTTTESLFDDDSYADDGALWRQVEAEWRDGMLAAERAKFAGQGWAWVADGSDLPRGWGWQWEHLHKGWAVDDAPAEMRARHEELERRQMAAETDDEAERIEAEIEALEVEMRIAAFTPEERARSGVVLSFDEYRGDVTVTLGVVRPSADGTEDIESAIDRSRQCSPCLDEDDESYDDDYADCCGESGEDLPSVSEVVGAGEDARDDFRITAALTQTLSEAQTIAASKALAANPDLAMRAITAALTCRFDAPVSVRNEGHHTVRDGRQAADFAELFRMALSWPQHVAEDVFAGAVAQTLDLTHDSWRYKSRETGIPELVAALPGESYVSAAREAFDASDYFKRASKAVALAAIDEMREAGAAPGMAPEDVLAGMKKGELAEAAADAARSCGWLPPELRHPSYALISSDGAQRLTGKDAAAEQSSEVAA